MNGLEKNIEEEEQKLNRYHKFYQLQICYNYQNYFVWKRLKCVHISCSMFVSVLFFFGFDSVGKNFNRYNKILVGLNVNCASLSLSNVHADTPIFFFFLYIIL